MNYLKSSLSEECEVCGDKLVDYVNNGRYCEKCGSIFATILPDDEYLKAYYEKFNIDYNGGGKIGNAEKKQIIYARKFLNIVERFAVDKGGKISAMDIGSSTNPFPNLMKSKGWDVSVMDYIKPKKLNKDIKYYETTLENSAVNGLGFDVVTAFAVLEHLKNPYIGIDKIIDMTRRGGVVGIYLPEIGRFPDKYAAGNTKWFFPPEHLNLLSPKNLICYFDEKNLDCLYCRRLEINVWRYAVRYGIGLIEGVFGYIIKIMYPQLWRIIRYKRKSLYQGVIFFVFKKK